MLSKLSTKPTAGKAYASGGAIQFQLALNLGFRHPIQPVKTAPLFGQER